MRKCRQSAPVKPIQHQLAVATNSSHPRNSHDYGPARRPRRHSHDYDREHYHLRRRTSSNPSPANYRTRPDRYEPSRHRRGEGYRAADDGLSPPKERLYQISGNTHRELKPTPLSHHGYRAPTPPRQYRDMNPQGSAPPTIKIGHLPSFQLPSDVEIPKKVQRIIDHCMSCHPLFKYSRCLGRKKAVCVRKTVYIPIC
jgi:hypothetical protein